jgi:hypothetical protein
MYAVTDLVVGLGAVAPRTIMNSMQKKRGEMEGEKKENRGGRGGAVRHHRHDAKHFITPGRGHRKFGCECFLSCVHANMDT